jgi:hypothetical protein
MSGSRCHPPMHSWESTGGTIPMLKLCDCGEKAYTPFWRWDEKTHTWAQIWKPEYVETSASGRATRRGKT